MRVGAVAVHTRVDQRSASRAAVAAAAAGACTGFQPLVLSIHRVSPVVNALSARLK